VLCFIAVMGWSPIFREIVMALGVINVSRDSCKFVLTQQAPGHSVAIVVGGSSDVLNLYPGSYILTLERRRGFIKLALETGYLLRDDISLITINKTFTVKLRKP